MPILVDSYLRPPLMIMRKPASEPVYLSFCMRSEPVHASVVLDLWHRRVKKGGDSEMGVQTPTMLDSRALKTSVTISAFE